MNIWLKIDQFESLYQIPVENPKVEWVVASTIEKFNQVENVENLEQLKFFKTNELLFKLEHVDFDNIDWVLDFIWELFENYKFFHDEANCIFKNTLEKAWFIMKDENIYFTELDISSKAKHFSAIISQIMEYFSIWHTKSDFDKITISRFIKSEVEICKKKNQENEENNEKSINEKFYKPEKLRYIKIWNSFEKVNFESKVEILNWISKYLEVWKTTKTNESRSSFLYYEKQFQNYWYECENTWWLLLNVDKANKDLFADWIIVNFLNLLSIRDEYIWEPCREIQTQIEEWMKMM